MSKRSEQQGQLESVVAFFPFIFTEQRVTVGARNPNNYPHLAQYGVMYRSFSSHLHSGCSVVGKVLWCSPVWRVVILDVLMLGKKCCCTKETHKNFCWVLIYLVVLPVRTQQEDEHPAISSVFQ